MKNTYKLCIQLFLSIVALVLFIVPLFTMKTILVWQLVVMDVIATICVIISFVINHSFQKELKNAKASIAKENTFDADLDEDCDEEDNFEYNEFDVEYDDDDDDDDNDKDEDEDVLDGEEEEF